MKIRIMILLMICILLSSCANRALPNVTPTTDAHATDGLETSTTPTDALSDDGLSVVSTKDFDVNILTQGGEGGTSDGINISSNAEFFYSSTDLPQSLPIYVNPYAITWGGELLYEITQDLKSTVSDNMLKFLTCLYDDLNAEDLTYTQNDYDITYQLFYTNNSTRISSSIHAMTVVTEDSSYGIDYISTDAELLNTPIVKAALEYLNWTSPVVTCTVDYKLDGTEGSREYKITEYTDDVQQGILNTSFSYITIRKSISLDRTSMAIRNENPDVFAKAAYLQMPKPSDVTMKLSQNIEEIDFANTKYEIFYSNAVSPGYYIPCYRFYVADENDADSNRNQIRYTKIIEASVLPDGALNN